LVANSGRKLSTAARVITVLLVNLHQMAADLRVQGLAIVIMGVNGSGLVSSFTLLLLFFSFWVFLVD